MQALFSRIEKRSYGKFATMRHLAWGWAFLAAACGGGGGDEPLGPCGAGGLCPEGYECHADDNMCYRSSGTKADAGSDGPIGARPATTLTGKPPAIGNAASVTFVFSSPVAGATFVCSVDGKPFAPCTSPLTTTVDEGQHSFAVAAVSGTLQDDTPETWTFKVDLTPPDTSITDGPSGTVSNSEALFSFTSTETGSTFECRSDGGSFSACTSGSTLTGFTVGAHTFEVRAIDPAGNVDASPATRSWTVDLTSPQTTIGSGPSALTNDPDASFAFSSDKAGSTFACTLDNQAAAPCTSPKSYTALGDGAHTFSVTATDDAGTPDPSPATFTWTIDTVPPAIRLDSGPAESATTGPAVTFTFSSPENAPPKPDAGGAGTVPATPAVTFECQLDTGAIAACDSPKAYTGLASGTRVFQVRGVDAATNRSAFIKRTWTVDASKPVVTVTAPKPNELTKGSGQIAFTGSESGMTFSCTLDGTAVAPCASPVAYSFTTDATHTFAITGSARGLTSDPVTVSWRADGMAPTVTIDDPAADGVTTGPSVDVAFSSEMGATFECKVGNGAFNACTSPLAVLLADGPASVTVHATDAAGNVSADARRSWTVDATGPVVTMQVTPLAGGATRANASVTYGSQEAGVTFECRAYIQGATAPAFAACAAKGITLGGYGFEHGDKVTIDVRGRDTFQNPGVAATTNATIDDQGPVITPTAPAAKTGASGSVAFTYDSNVDASGTFTCSVLDAGGSVVTTAACSPGNAMAFGPLVQGTYVARVDGVDAVGNTSRKDTTFGVDTTGPTMAAVKCSSPTDGGKINCYVASTDADVASYHCRVDGGAYVDCSGGKVTFAEQSQGTHSVDAFATDDVGNSGAPLGASANVVFAFADIVVIAHDYTGVSTAKPGTAEILGNALKVSYVVKKGFSRAVNVLEWCGNCGAAEEQNVRKVILAQGVQAKYAVTNTTDHTAIAKQLVGRDVLLVPDQNGLATMAELGKNCNVELRTFLGNGGLIVLLDGTFVDVTGAPAASRTAQMLVGAGMLDAPTYDINGVKPGSSILVNPAAVKLNDPIALGFLDQSKYDAPANTVLLVRDTGFTSYLTVFGTDVSHATVLHECIANATTICANR